VTLVLQGTSQEESGRRRAFIQRAVRLNQSEGSEPIARHLAYGRRSEKQRIAERMQAHDL
jgi:hypothetical protein